MMGDLRVELTEHCCSFAFRRASFPVQHTFARSGGCRTFSQTPGPDRPLVPSASSYRRAAGRRGRHRPQWQAAYLQAIGTYDRAGKVPLKPDAIFWIASMTKPVTSVAAMMLVEEGKLDLTAPVAEYLPVFKDKPVGVEDIDPATGKHTLLLEHEKRPMQVIDLLRHTTGLVYPEEGKTALHRMYGLADFRRNRTLADFVASLAYLPLAHQPGEVWEYSWSVDVLALVIEVVSGQSFDQFLDSRIFKQLRMVDTGFYVPDEKRARLVDPIPSGRPALWDVTKPAKLFSGGGGLVSTAPDYLRFCQMLLNGGELDGVRILSAKTVQQMTTNALPPDVRFAGVNGQFVGPRVGTGWGLGFAIRTNPTSAFCRAPSQFQLGRRLGNVFLD